MIVLNLELRSSKNSRKIVHAKGRMLVIKSKIAREQDKVLADLLPKNKPVWDQMVKGKPFPLKVSFSVYKSTKRRWDWANLIQGLADAMVKYGYMPDDDTSHFTPVFDKWGVDKENPRVEVDVL